MDNSVYIVSKSTTETTISPVLATMDKIRGNIVISPINEAKTKAM